MIPVDKNRVVVLHYIMRNGRGKVVQDTMQTGPVTYLHGSTTILPLLQQQLIGLNAGDKQRVFLPEAESEADDDFIFDVVIDDVRAALPEEILLGYPINNSTEICEEDCACYAIRSL